MIRQVLLFIFFCFVISVDAQTERKYIRDGNRMFHKKEYAKSEILYRKAIDENPANSQALYNLGCALMMQNKDSAAISQYQKAVKVEKNKLRLSRSFHNIGVICQNHRMYGEAIKAYENALRNNPKDNETRYNLVLCKRLQKDNNKKENNENNKQKNEGKEENQDKNDNKNENKQPKPKEQMSKDNAEQLLNAAIQNEKATQQRMKQAMRKPSSSRRLQKNW